MPILTLIWATQSKQSRSSHWCVDSWPGCVLTFLVVDYIAMAILTIMGLSCLQRSLALCPMGRGHHDVVCRVCFPKSTILGCLRANRSYTFGYSAICFTAVVSKHVLLSRAHGLAGHCCRVGDPTMDHCLVVWAGCSLLSWSRDWNALRFVL